MLILTSFERTFKRTIYKAVYFEFIIFNGTIFNYFCFQPSELNDSQKDSMKKSAT
jgi:hypothetical protein